MCGRSHKMNDASARPARTVSSDQQSLFISWHANTASFVMTTTGTTSSAACRRLSLSGSLPNASAPSAARRWTTGRLPLFSLLVVLVVVERAGARRVRVLVVVRAGKVGQQPPSFDRVRARGPRAPSPAHVKPPRPRRRPGAAARLQALLPSRKLPTASSTLPPAASTQKRAVFSSAEPVMAMKLAIAASASAIVS